MKTLEEFTLLFAEQFDETDPLTITQDTAYHELDEWSSLVGLSIIAMVDEEFDVPIKGDDIKNSTTIKDLYEKIISKM